MQAYTSLTERQAEKLYEQFGPNVIAGKKKSGAIKMFASQFRDTMIVILLCCTLISVLMGEYSEALTVVAIVLLNAVLGFIQEWRTEKTLERLGEMSAPIAVVVRDGVIKKLEASLLVPGDIIKLSAGERVPADCEVISEASLSLDESMLSGESVAVHKRPLGEGHGRECKAFMGTIVMGGSAVCRITATGANTEMGGIAGMLGSIEVSKTPLQKKLSELGKFIGAGCLLVCAVVAVCGVLRGEGLFDMLLVGISLAVAAVPEGLPAIVTVSLALSVGRMVKCNALVRRLHAVESLGCATVICSDKTGTLTQNKMTVKAIYTLGSMLELPQGKAAGRLPRISLRTKAETELVRIAALCNNSEFSGARQDEVFGEPTEAALLLLASAAGISRERFTRQGEWPFDSTRKAMSVAVKSPGTGRMQYTKGAPERLLLSSRFFMGEDGSLLPLSASKREAISGEIARMADMGLRVLGFFSKSLPEGAPMSEQELCFIGLAGIFDPPRPEAAAAVKKCREAGVRPIMITGDYPATARAIAAELGIYRGGDRIVSGEELKLMPDGELTMLLPKISVFARVSPADKLRIVKAFKSRREVVAMTGDGVNDAPAVSAADIGVSMGISGTDVTKEAAAVILLDDNFATLVTAIEEGRIIYRNIRKFIRYLLSCNIGEVFTMFFSMLAGMPIPLTPIQILLINLVTDGLPAVALGMEGGERDVMKCPPRRPDESVFSDGLLSTIVFRGLLIGITTVASFSLTLQSCGSLATARTAAMTTLILSQLVHVFECKSEKRGLFSINPFDNLWLVFAVLASVAALILSIYKPFFASVFDTVPLFKTDLFRAVIISLVVPALSSVQKMIFKGSKKG